jgi:hypothetical protein
MKENIMNMTEHSTAVKELMPFLKVNFAEAVALVDVGITVDSLKAEYGNLPGDWIKRLM